MRYLLLLTLLFACNLEPKYEKPKPSIVLEESNNNIAGIPWEDFITSPQLKQVINNALEHNQDLKAAHLNIESARAMFNIKRADLLPTLNAIGSVTRQQAPAPFALFTPKEMYRANLGVAAYELDFFGKVRNLKKAAYEQYLATEEARNITRITIIAYTTNAYIQLLADRKILSLTKEAMNEQKRKLGIVRERRKHGRVFQIDVILAATEYENIKVLYNSYLQAVELDTNALMLLTGIFDKNSIPSSSFEKLTFNEKLIEFMPSESLLLRPDIKKAEHELKAANANIGAARAAFFTSITLTGSYGYFSHSLSDLLSSNAWYVMPQFNVPIFDGGKNRGNLKLSKVQKEILVANYQKTLQTAFKEVLDELANRKTTLENIKSYNNIVQLNEQSNQIIRQQYANGQIDAIMALNSYLNLVTARQNAVIHEANRMKNLVTLYKVLGGGNNTQGSSH